MPEFWESHEVKLVQERAINSGADALFVYSGTVPSGKVWTLINACYNPGVAETKIVFFQVNTKSGMGFALSVPVSIALSATRGYPLLTPGMEYKMYPGDLFLALRDSATAGSIMQLNLRFIETDLPYYSYEEPLNKVVKQAQRHGSVYRSTGGISTGGEPAGSGAPSKGGSGGVPESY